MSRNATSTLHRIGAPLQQPLYVIEQKQYIKITSTSLAHVTITSFLAFLKKPNNETSTIINHLIFIKLIKKVIVTAMEGNKKCACSVKTIMISYSNLE